MSKLKQSIAVQRQIPEHIRINYPAFVEFIKLYYEFLEETQAQNLEKIRDVDDTLEEFIDKFKEELAKNIPIELASDKRTLLKYIRQFYLSRGSEESFKFVFKALFGQEAELHYPSTQMLRVSDGKWQQEISVFVRITGTTPNLFAVDGKFINIITPRKTIQTFVSGVSAYNELTYEVFIERDFANEITIGSTIRFVDPSGGTYTGEIVPCPSKIKVYKRGRGFRVGQLFSLKTSLGSGCLVKITKTTADGGIEVVQPIRFGLDYVSKFYSYLSSKSIQAYEYVHPLEIGAGQSSYQEYTAAPVSGAQTFTVQYLIENGIPLLLVDVIRNNASVSVTYTATNGTNVNISGLLTGDTVKLYGVTTKGIAPAPNNPGYNEKYSGFIDYGFASMQTYMDYDITIPVQRELVGSTLKDTHASDRFFADPSYVGDIVQQFYTDSSAGVFDDDLAIIEIDIGAVARYPGYYRTSDGFISDEMHIQDGKYYQAFSYVIRVEEELRKYANIIKSLVHPSGMKMFAEYNIFNHIIVSANVPNIFKFLQFSDTVSNIGDTSYNYDSYVFSLNGDGLIEYIPASNAGIVFTRQNKAAIFPTKNLSDSIVEGLNTRNLVNSQGQDVIIIDNYSELRDKGVIKPFTEAIAENYLISTENDSANTSHTFIKNYAETYIKAVSKPLEDSISELLTTVPGTDSSGIIHSFIKNYAETHVKEINKPLPPEFIAHTETDVKAVDKPFPPELITERLTSASVNDSANNSHTLIRNYDETILKSPSKPLTEAIPENFASVNGSDSASTSHTFITNYSETFTKDYTKAHIETLQAQFNRTLNYIHEVVKPLTETVLHTEAFPKLVEKPLTETILHTEDFPKFVEKPLTETVASTDIDNFIKEVTLNKTETVLQPETIVLDIVKALQETLILLEDISKTYFKNVPDELILLSEEIAQLVGKPIVEDPLFSTDTSISDFQKNVNDSISITPADSIINEYSKNLGEVLILIELYANSLQKFLTDEAFAGDTNTISKQPELYKSSLATIDPFENFGIIKIPTSGTGEIRIHEVMQLIVDFIDIVRTISLFDETFAVDSGQLLDFRKTISELINTIEAQSKGFALGTINEPSLIVSDIPYSLTTSKPISDDVSSTSIPDVNIKATGKATQESINTIMNGKLVLNSYFSELEAETYYDVFDTIDYQLSTTLS
jgi:hypothetical protein